MIQKWLRGRRFPLRPHILLILLICGLLSCPVPTHAQAQPQNPLSEKNVLILHAFESNVPIFELTDRGLRAALDAGGVGIRNQFFEYLDLARNPGPEHIQRLGELLRLRYGHRKIDVIIALYPEALRFVLKEGLVIFPDVPILGLYMPPGIELPNTDRRIIQHLVNRDVGGTLEIALNLVPGAKRVFVVSGAHELDRKVEDLARGDFKKWEGPLEFRYLSALTEQTLPLPALDEFADTHIAQRFSMVTGVAQVQVFGSQRYAVRVLLDPEALSKRGLGLERVVSAIQNANSNLPSGVLQGAARDFTVKSSATLQRAENFNNLIVAYKDGMPVRLSGVGQAVDGIENAKVKSWLNGERSILLAVYRQPGAITVEVASQPARAVPGDRGQRTPWRAHSSHK